MRNEKVMFEVCVDSAQGLLAAIAGGADRVELCSALALGGLTPGPGLINLASRSSIPSHVMIRPRAGDFVYSIDDLDVMLADIEAVKTAGLTGVVVGALLADNTLDTASLECLLTGAGDLQKTLHRAFDLAIDPAVALETAIELGFTRILTSGQADNAPDGSSLISSLVRQAAGRIQIMAGGGVKVDSIVPLLSTGVDAIHASCGTPVLAQKDCSLIGIDQRLETDQGLVAKFNARIEVADAAC